MWVNLLDKAESRLIHNGNVILFPCPLVQRYTAADPTGWIGADAGPDLETDAYRIGIAHGSVVDFEPEEGGTTPNLIDPAIVQRGNLDYLALGDWHGRRQVNDRAWYSGTPEPDRFKNNDAGHLLLVEIETPRSTPRVEPIPVGGCRWLLKSATIHGEPDLEILERWFDEIERPEQTLVRLELQGVLGMAAYQRLNRLLETQKDLLLYLRIRGTGVVLAPSDEELETMGGAGLTGRVVDQLRRMLDRQDEEAARATVALQILYEKTRPSGGGGVL